MGRLSKKVKGLLAKEQSRQGDREENQGKGTAQVPAHCRSRRPTQQIRGSLES